MSHPPSHARWRSLAAGAVLLVTLAAPRSASAQSEQDLQRAREAFAEGETAEAAGDCQRAIDRFGAALAIRETSQILLRIGRCQEKIGDLRAAQASYDRALAIAPDARVREIATELAQAMRERVPRLTLELGALPTGLVVTLDGERVDPSSEIALNPGSHVLRAEAPGHDPFETTFDLVERQLRSVAFTLSPLGSRPTEPTEPADSDASSTGPGPLPFVLLGTGAVAIGVGVGLFASGASLSSDIDARCGGDRESCGFAAGTPQAQQVADDIADVNTRYGVSYVLWGVGAAAAAVGVVLLLTGDDDESVAAIRPIVGPSTVGLTVGGSFF